MIEIAKTIPNPDKLATWLEQNIRKHLRPDISNYAKGRLRAWLRTEPTLTNPTRFLPGIPISDPIWGRLKELSGFNFDFALATYSGDETGVGISAHRDASYADYEAYALHITGECRFDYWEERHSFGYSGTSTTLPSKAEATQSLILKGGELIHFNCKNRHAATPGAKRWNINFWRAK